MSDDHTHDHDPACEKLSAYLDDELPDDLKLRVSQHLASCGPCRHLHDDLAALLRCCAEHAPSLEVPTDVHDALMDALRRDSAGR